MALIKPLRPYYDFRRPYKVNLASFLNMRLSIATFHRPQYHNHNSFSFLASMMQPAHVLQPAGAPLKEHTAKPGTRALRAGQNGLVHAGILTCILASTTPGSLRVLHGLPASSRTWMHTLLERLLRCIPHSWGTALRAGRDGLVCAAISFLVSRGPQLFLYSDVCYTALIYPPGQWHRAQEHPLAGSRAHFFLVDEGKLQGEEMPGQRNTAA